MKRVLGILAAAAAGGVFFGCSSEPLDANSGAAGSGGQAGHTLACSAALRQKLSLVDETSTAVVSILSESDGEQSLYVDASGGGIAASEMQPWVYLSLKTGMALGLTDIDALKSTEWDLAFKRNLIRTNSGDSGPGDGGALRVGLAWEKVTRATLGNKALPTESWFTGDQCEIPMDKLDSLGNVLTTYASWSEYDQATHVVSAAPDTVFITAGGDGTVYKVQIEDYYSTPSGAHGTIAGRYKLRAAPLP
ncbi:MAG TPA: HmuY family protein [Polyangiaceae bacterium]|nr:HmuY family protein [Polyangiaceae bacterium]